MQAFSRSYCVVKSRHSFMASRASGGKKKDRRFLFLTIGASSSTRPVDAGAQTNLGTLYLHGEGAPQSDQMALFWFSQAAEQRDALAFAKLGLMYVQGRGVLQDYIQAHMWYNLSAAYGENRSAEARDALAKQMTPAQIAEAQRLAREWKPKMNKSSQTVP